TIFLLDVLARQVKTSADEHGDEERPYGRTHEDGLRGGHADHATRPGNRSNFSSRARSVQTIRIHSSISKRRACSFSGVPYRAYPSFSKSRANSLPPLRTIFPWIITC